MRNNSSYTARRAQKRRAQAQVANARIRKPVLASTLTFDPLARTPPSFQERVGRAAGLVAGSTVVYSSALAMLALISPALEAAPRQPEVERVEITMQEPPKPPKIEAAEPQKEKAPPPKPKVKPKPEPKRPDSATPENNEAPAEPPRRVVGLSFGSTTQGAGPAFAVGDTVQGRTARTAEVPLPQAPVTSSDGQTRTTRVPSRGTHFQKPKRLAALDPQYPELQRAQGIEADVTVRVEISASGDVLAVSVVQGAKDEAFNQAAIAAAKRERFTAATENDSPIAWNLTFTYRFRLND